MLALVVPFWKIIGHYPRVQAVCYHPYGLFCTQSTVRFKWTPHGCLLFVRPMIDTSWRLCYTISQKNNRWPLIMFACTWESQLSLKSVTILVLRFLWTFSFLPLPSQISHLINPVPLCSGHDRSALATKHGSGEKWPFDICTVRPIAITFDVPSVHGFHHLLRSTGFGNGWSVLLPTVCIFVILQIAIVGFAIPQHLPAKPGWPTPGDIQ